MTPQQRRELAEKIAEAAGWNPFFRSYPGFIMAIDRTLAEHLGQQDGPGAPGGDHDAATYSAAAPAQAGENPAPAALPPSLVLTEDDIVLLHEEFSNGTWPSIIYDTCKRLIDAQPGANAAIVRNEPSCTHPGLKFAGVWNGKGYVKATVCVKCRQPVPEVPLVG